MRLIDADALQERLKKKKPDPAAPRYVEGFNDAILRFKSMVHSAPTIKPERKKGKWIDAYPDIESNPMFMYGICSVCSYEQAISNKLNFCPNCGAGMQGGLIR